MKRLVILALALAGCSHPEPGIEIRTVTVTKEVPRPCPGEVPVRPSPLGDVPDDARQALAKVAAKLAEYSDRGKYADKAESYFKTCPPTE